MTIDLKGIHRLSVRLKVQLQPHGINLNTEAFSEMLEMSNSTQNNVFENIIRFCSDVLYPQVALQREQEKEEDLEDAIDNTRRSKSASKAFDVAISDLNKESEEDGGNEDRTMKLGEKMKMFTVVDKKYSQGSTEVARGKQMGVLPQKVIPSERITRTTKLINEACNYCRVATERAEV